MLCKLENNLKLTPNHPFMQNGVWKLPKHVSTPRLMNYTTHYNFILEKDHIGYINDVPLIFLGHDYEDDDVLKHPYYGSQEIVRDL